VFGCLDRVFAGVRADVDEYPGLIQKPVEVLELRLDSVAVEVDTRPPNPGRFVP
jgi:hypothetical protein